MTKRIPACGGERARRLGERAATAGRTRTEIELTATNVIHSTSSISFWVAALGGKTDKFPGKLTRMSLAPMKAGVWRGQCAEFFGLSHALMARQAVTMEEAAFDAWLAGEASDASADAPSAGRDFFFGEGCGACHSLRGTDAVGAVGPDLRLGGRVSLAGGILPMNGADGRPGNLHIPRLDILSEEYIALALETYRTGTAKAGSCRMRSAPCPRPPSPR